jgi:hypothetical protein
VLVHFRRSDKSGVRTILCSSQHWRILCDAGREMRRPNVLQVVNVELTPLKSRVDLGNDHLTHDPVEVEIVKHALRLRSRNGRQAVLYTGNPMHLTCYFGLNLGVWQFSPIRTSIIDPIIGSKQML